ncbi:MAG: bile acid:sodium symporter family protein, partial [Halomonadaceae bacterium]
MENDVNILLDVLLPWTLRFIMFGMGLLLTVSDFIRLKEYPRAVVAGLGGQVILLPLVGL